MKYLDMELQSHKISKNLPQIWTSADKDIPDNEMFVVEDFLIYAGKLFKSLLGIKQFYEKEFNADNDCTIDEYIELFNHNYDKFLKAIIPNEQRRTNLIMQELGAGRDYWTDARFSILEDILKDKDVFAFKDGKVVGFSSEAYSNISKHAQQLFLIEKLCSFTTRKFWQNEITKFEDLDLNKPYKILVKCVLADDWRNEKKSKKLKEYMQNKTYHSTSLIDQDSFYKTFFSCSKNYALLLMDYDDNDFICASPSDDYSEEVIDGNNPLQDKKIFSDVLLQDGLTKNNKNHKFFAEAVECETPKNVLSNIKLYSEINLKDIKPKAVIAPNANSLKFAKEISKQYGDIPVLLKDEK